MPFGGKAGRLRFDHSHLAQFFAEHGRDQFGLINVREVEICDVSPVTQDRGVVAHLEDLPETMGDEEDRTVAALQFPHDIEDMPGLIRRQGGGDLIEHEQLGVTRQSAGQVEQPQHRQRHVADQ